MQHEYESVPAKDKQLASAHLLRERQNGCEFTSRDTEAPSGKNNMNEHLLMMATVELTTNQLSAESRTLMPHDEVEGNVKNKPSGVARPKLMVGPDYRGTKEALEDLALTAPG